MWGDGGRGRDADRQQCEGWKAKVMAYFWNISVDSSDHVVLNAKII
jgi:hypothetical protein